MPFDTHQKKVISHDADSLVVLATAGSGKTTTMIGTVQRLLDLPNIVSQLDPKTRRIKIEPEKIRIASFTNIAADTFRAKMLAVTNGQADGVKISTMDTFAIEIIKHAYPNASVDMDENAIAETLYKDMNHITDLQSMYQSYGEYFDDIVSCNRQYAGSFERAKLRYIYSNFLDEYVKYITKKYHKNDAFSIPLEVVYRFAVMTMIEHRFIPDIDVLIVDELQDTSDAQFVLLSFLQAQKDDMKFIGIGDVSQSMYRWNNAKPQRVAQYIDEYGADVLQLPNNYRSHPKIIEFANELLAENLDNISNIQITPAPTATFNNIPDEHRIQYMTSIMDMLEQIRDDIKSGVKPKDIAVIARSTNALQSVKTLNDQYFRIEFDESHVTKNKRIQYLQYVLRTLSSFEAHIDELREDLHKIMDFLVDQRLSDGFKDEAYFNKLKSTNASQYYQELKQLIKLKHERVNERLKQTLYSNKVERDDTRVKLSTVHGVKGDEYKIVYYIPSIRVPANREILPDPKMDREQREHMYGEYAESQNIHYVAITRAIEQIYIVEYGTSFQKKKDEIQNLKSKNKGYNKDLDILLHRF